jgi:hypothetical protein
MSRVQCVFVASVVAVLSSVAVAQTDQHVGTWKMNPAKSSFKPGPAPKALTLVYTSAAGGNLVVLLQGTDPESKPINPDKNTQAITMDEKDHATTGNQNWDTTSWKRVNANTFEVIRKKAGKTVQTGTNTVSADGKTMTVTSKGVSPDGKPNSTSLAVYDKQ